MSLIIKGMDMPEKCENCPCYDYIDYVCRADDCFAPFDVENPEERSEHCPLIEIPTPHGRLIDADALMECRLEPNHYEELKDGYIPDYDLDSAPTIIEAEVSEE